MKLYKIGYKRPRAIRLATIYANDEQQAVQYFLESKPDAIILQISESTKTVTEDETAKETK